MASRTPNYSFREKETLLRLVAAHKAIIENKKSDTVTIHDKNNAWQTITEKFNTLSPALVQRKMESLKKLYNNQKEELRKKLGNERREIYRTGGGPPSSFKTEPTDDLLISIISNKTLKGVPNCDAPYDDDFISGKDETIMEVFDSRKVIMETPSLTEPETEPSQSILKPFKLRTPLNKSLRQIKKIHHMDNINNIEVEVNDMYSNYLENQKTEREMTTITPQKKSTSKISPKCTSFAKIKGSSSFSGRRPALVKTLSSSKLGEMYEELCQKKLDVIDGLKREHALRMEVLQLEKKIQEAKLERILKGGSFENLKTNNVRSVVDIDQLIGESVEYTL